MLAGTAVFGSPQLINCKSAICALASCIATRSGLSFRLACPRISLPLFVLVRSDSSGESKCEYKIFSARVSWREEPRTRRTSLRRPSSFLYGGVREAISTLRAFGMEVEVARHRAWEERREERR